VTVRPLDPRLVKYAGAARGYLAAAVLFGLVTTGLILAQAGLLARLLATAARGLSLAAVAAPLAALAVVIAARAAAGYGGEVVALRAAATVKSQLRSRLMAQVSRLGPGWLTGQRAGEITTLATRGLDALDSYFARYLPQLVLACLVPVAVIIRVALADWISAVIIIATIPLIPVFAILIGLHTRARTDRQWQLLARLGGHFQDVTEGLATLKAYGRGKAQAEVIETVTGQHRHATMATLRIAFLSALVLELAATISTALVAVEVGLRLLAGHLGYYPAILVLILTPEAYLPLRNAGAQFHASMEGTAAASDVFAILETPVPAAAVPPRAVRRGRVDLRDQVIGLREVSLRYPGQDHLALDRISLEIRPGQRILLTGPSGAGKTSLLRLLLRFAEPAGGLIEVGGVPLDEVPLDEWRAQVCLVPQQPHLFAASVADNIALGRPRATREAIARAAALAGAEEFISELPDGYGTMLGERGLRLSSGQRQRIAIARAFCVDAPLMLLDEPGAHLDPFARQDLQSVLAAGMTGHTVVQVAHEPAAAGAGARVIPITGGRLAAPVLNLAAVR
jgi:ATP-binding cassette subfamily C protein CydD